MAMLKFSAYTGRDIQNFFSMLNQCEIEGVTDIRYVRERIQNYINRQYKVTRVSKRKVIKENKELLGKKPSVSRKPTSQYEVCPACGNKTLRLLTPLEGLVRKGCKCQYSEVIK